ncbi:MAG: hypothetical protein ACFFD1_03675 [Candidatus Thorarchaeota archaeon]
MIWHTSVPLKFALPIALIVPLLTLILFSLIGAGSNSLLAQIEIVLLAIFFCLTGILTRSKLRGVLLSVPVTWVVILIYELLIGPFLGSSNYDPYAVFGVLKEPILNILRNPSLNIPINENTVLIGNFTVGDSLNLLIVFDLLILTFIVFFGSFFISSVATLFWDKEGNLKIGAVIFKPFAALFAILLLVIFPLAIHGVSSATGATGYMAAGFVEMYAGLFPNTSTLSIAQLPNGIDLSTLDFQNLIDHSQLSKQDFQIANEKFQQLQGNVLLSFLINTFFPQYQDVDKVLNLVGTLAEVSGALPNLIYIVYNVQQGLEITATSIDSAQKLNTSASNGITYDPNFKVGLKFLDYGYSNFTQAWDCGNQTNCGLKYGIQQAQSLENVQSINKLVNVNEFISALDASLTAIQGSWSAFTDFLNGTYKTILGISALSSNSFNNASNWMGQATSDFIKSNNTLGALTDINPVNITVYQGDQPTVIPIPIDSVIHVAQDLNSLLIPFSYAGESSVKFFISMRNLMNGMNALNMSDTSSVGSDTTWDSVGSYLTSASNELNSATGNITNANTQLEYRIANPRYGEFNDAFVGPEGSDTIFRMFQQITSTLSGNLTGLGDILSALSDTFQSFKAFGKGSVYASDALTNSTARTIASTYYNQSKNYAGNAWIKLHQLTGSVHLNEGSRIAWIETLISPYPDWNPNSTFTLNGLQNSLYSGIFVVSDVMGKSLASMNQTDVDNFLALVESLNLGSLFGNN